MGIRSKLCFLFPKLYKIFWPEIKGTLRPFIQLTKPEKIKIGKGTILREYSFVRGDVSIGSDCVLSNFLIIDAGRDSKIEIGNNTTIGGGTKIWAETTYYKPGPPNKSMIRKSVKIGNRVIIGSNATILPGVTIGDDAVIGANAAVTKDIPPKALAVGVPAEVKKFIE